MTQATTVTVAGAGVLGLATALALADAGCVVSLHDPGGANASGVAAGMLAPAFEAVLDLSARPHLDLLLGARDLWPALAMRAGIMLDRAGAIAVGDEPWLAGVGAAFQAVGLRTAEIGGATARTLAPGLCGGIGRALMTREDWRVDAAVALKALCDAAVAAGVTVRSDRVAGRGDADFLVVATGAAPDLAALAPALTRLSPIKGHIVRLEAPSRGVVVRAQGVYAAPGEAMLFGATMEPGETRLDIDPKAAGPLVSRGLALFPGLAATPRSIQTGIRAATPDGLPMVGHAALPGRSTTVLLAAGARRNGWLLAPLVAQVITAYVTGRDPGRFAARLDPARFGG